MTDWRIERLTSSHERAAFVCGKPPLDDFFRSLTSRHESTVVRLSSPTADRSRPSNAQVKNLFDDIQ